MSIDWASDHFVRLYTRETEEDLLLSWEARAVWNELLKKFDKQGNIVARKGARTIAALIRYPVEVVERALPDLLEDGRLEQTDNGFRAPNYEAANYTPRSSAARKAYSRLATQIGHHPVAAEPSDVAGTDPAGDLQSSELDNKMSRDVTSSHGAEPPRDKTSIRSDQIRSGHTQSRARARSDGRSSIPPDWAPSQAERDLAISLGLDVDAEAREFVAYWRSEGKPKADWDQAFRSRLEQRGQQRRRAGPKAEIRELNDL